MLFLKCLRVLRRIVVPPVLVEKMEFCSWLRLIPLEKRFFYALLISVLQSYLLLQTFLQSKIMKSPTCKITSVFNHPLMLTLFLKLVNNVVRSFVLMSLSREAFSPSARNSSRKFICNAIVMKADMTS